MPRPFLSIRPRIVYLIWTNNPVEIRLLLLFLRSLHFSYTFSSPSSVSSSTCTSKPRLVSSRLASQRRASSRRARWKGRRRRRRVTGEDPTRHPFPCFPSVFRALKFPRTHTRAQKKGEGGGKKERKEEGRSGTDKRGKRETSADRRESRRGWRKCAANRACSITGYQVCETVRSEYLAKCDQPSNVRPWHTVAFQPWKGNWRFARIPIRHVPIRHSFFLSFSSYLAISDEIDYGLWTRAAVQSGG